MYRDQITARTGRLSCSKPNLQSIPREKIINDSLKLNCRSFFVPTRSLYHIPFNSNLEHKQKLFVSADYSQIEIRVLAHVCQDPALIKLFQTQKDIYTNLAGINLLL